VHLQQESIMKFRFSLIALVSAVSLPALATSGITPVGGEAGFTTHAMPSTKSRADVIKELEAWKRNPVTADGWREVGGDAFVGTNNPGKTRLVAAGSKSEARQGGSSSVSRATRVALRRPRSLPGPARPTSPVG
jgi:hypothetical protein